MISLPVISSQLTVAACQDTRSGDIGDVVARTEVGHDPLVDLVSKEAFEATDDFACGPTVSGASGGVRDGRLVELHTNDDGSSDSDSP